MFLLDTNVISETRKPRPDPGLSRWLDGVPALDLYMCVMSLGEIRKGIERFRAADAKGAAEIEGWLNDVEDAFEGRILPIDRRVAQSWGLFSARSDLHAVDAMLAATARVHNLTLVTRNVRHVMPFGIDLLNPFAG
jgi:predicted nucleic acid-binding protein